jgi:GR25 family glycosyltransferase involved in LPS biosynthesis
MKVEHILYINLEHRVDRKSHVENQLKQIGLVGERFNAIKLKNGRIGCTMSHIKCLEIAIKRNYDHVFICEDDILFLNPEMFKENLNKFLNNTAIKWDVMIVAGNNIPPYKKINNYCVKINNCQTTTGYIVKQHYFKTLLNNFREGIIKLMNDSDNHFEFAIDKYWFKLQERDNWYLIIPLSVIQLEGYSDIEGKRVDYYKHLMLDLNKEEFMKRLKKSQEMNELKNVFRILK